MMRMASRATERWPSWSSPQEQRKESVSLWMSVSVSQLSVRISDGGAGSVNTISSFNLHSLWQLRAQPLGYVLKQLRVFLPEEPHAVVVHAGLVDARVAAGLLLALLQRGVKEVVPDDRSGVVLDGHLLRALGVALEGGQRAVRQSSLYPAPRLLPDEPLLHPVVASPGLVHLGHVGDDWDSEARLERRMRREFPAQRRWLLVVGEQEREFAGAHRDVPEGILGVTVRGPAHHLVRELADL